MKNNIEIARELLNRNISGFGRNIDEFSKWLATNYSKEELTNTSTLKCCSLCGGIVEMEKRKLEDNKVLYSPECIQCHAGSESFYSEELAILSHNTESWFDDGFYEE